MAVDDPGPPCGPVTNFGGSFPIPEDWRGGEPDFEEWFLLGLQCNPLANDADPDGDPMTLVIDTPPAHGEAVVLPDGFGMAYDPDEDFSTLAGDWVSDTITYRVTAGGESSDQATIRLWVAPINDPPSFSPGSDLSVEAADGPYSGTWATAISPGPSNESHQTVDFVVEVRPGDYDLFTTPPAIASDGTLTFTPVAGANGTAQATVWAVDDGGTSNDLNVPAGDIDAPDDTSEPVTFSIAIAPGGDPHLAVEDEITIPEDFGGPLWVVANDLAPENEASIIAYDGIDPTLADFTQNFGNYLWYSTADDASGVDVFTYTLSSGSSTTVTLTIEPVNDAPMAAIETFTVDEGSTLTVAAPGILANDSDVDGDAVTVHGISYGPLFGTLDWSVDGAFTYVPDAGFSGTDTFTYQATDGELTSTFSTQVTIDVGPVNDPPVADNETLIVAEDAAATAVPVLTGDTDPDGPNALKVTAVTNGSKGTVAIAGGGTGLTYKPGANKVGTDTFTYTVSDGLLTDTATVSVTITPVQDAPTAINDRVTLPEGAGATAVNVLGNDLDLDGDVLKITARTNGAKGVVAITGGGTGLTYDPGALQNGTDTFTYTVSDGKGGTDSATVVVTITPDTAAPFVVAPSQRLPGQTLTSNATNTVKAELAWSGSDPGSGVASYQFQVSVDGGAYSTISLPTATATSVQRTLTFGHRYQFRVRATDRRGNRSAFAYVPALTPGRHQETSSLATYIGAWTTSTNADMSGGTGRWASAATARARFTFTGRDIAWVATRTTTSGRAQVWVDGVLVATVSLRADPIKHRQIVFSRHWSSTGTHTVEIRPLGDGRVYIDAWVALR